MPYQTLQSKTRFEGRVFAVRQDVIELPDGRQATLDVIEHAPAVTLVPVDEDSRVWFVRQYRHPAGATLLELPAGVVEPGEQPEACAAREAREEIGMAAGSLQKVGEFFLAPGYSTELMHVFIATGLRPDPLAQDEDEFLTVEQIPIDQVYALAHTGAFRDAKTLAALYLARPFIS